MDKTFSEIMELVRNNGDHKIIELTIDLYGKQQNRKGYEEAVSIFTSQHNK